MPRKKIDKRMKRTVTKKICAQRKLACNIYKKKKEPSTFWRGKKWWNEERATQKKKKHATTNFDPFIRIQYSSEIYYFRSRACIVCSMFKFNDFLFLVLWVLIFQAFWTEKLRLNVTTIIELCHLFNVLRFSSFCIHSDHWNIGLILLQYSLFHNVYIILLF